MFSGVLTKIQSSVKQWPSVTFQIRHAFMIDDVIGY